MVIKDPKVSNFPDDKIMLNEIVHVCIVVRNVEKKAKILSEKFGISPFRIRQQTYPESQATMRGESVEYTLKFGYSKMGPIVLELVETISGKTSYQEFLEEHGEGIHHIGFPTPVPFDKELEKWRKQGIEAIQISRLDDPEEGWAYMDTQPIAGFIMEILSFKRYQQ
jgi:hypothetical protein